jgi:hypothetical protein
MTRLPKLGLALLLVSFVGCSGDSSTPPTGPTTEPGPTRSLVEGGATLIDCPAAETQTGTGLIGPLGGILSAGNVSVVVPANAVLAPTTFILTAPPSNYLEIDVKTADAEHFVFELPVVVSIDYGRCGLPLLHSTLTAWNIDPDTKALLEQMPSVDNPLTHTLIFSTIHFSGYAVAD